MIDTFTPLGVGSEYSCSRSGCRGGHFFVTGKPDRSLTATLSLAQWLSGPACFAAWSPALTAGRPRAPSVAARPAQSRLRRGRGGGRSAPVRSPVIAAVPCCKARETLRTRQPQELNWHLTTRADSNQRLQHEGGRHACRHSVAILVDDSAARVVLDTVRNRVVLTSRDLAALADPGAGRHLV